MHRVNLNPIPGFCIKSATVQSAVYVPVSVNPQILEQHGPINVPKGFKVFVNIAFDRNVPAPPEGNEETIQRAMQGEIVDQVDPDGWYVPVVVSEGRLDKDKAGKPALVFDCVYNSSIKSRILRDAEFKLFVIELSLQRIEAQARLELSRQVGTPNIAAKGKLDPRTVTLPETLVPKPLWTWTKQGDRLQVNIPVPKIGSETTLDVEARRIIVSGIVDINLNMDDLPANASLLKQQRPFDVDGAIAEWREGQLVILA